MRSEDNMPVAHLVAGVCCDPHHLQCLAQDCTTVGAESADDRARRESAVRYIVAVNTALARTQGEMGKYAPLSDLLGLPSVPLGSSRSWSSISGRT